MFSFAAELVDKIDVYCKVILYNSFASPNNKTEISKTTIIKLFKNNLKEGFTQKSQLLFWVKSGNISLGCSFVTVSKRVPIPAAVTTTFRVTSLPFIEDLIEIYASNLLLFALVDFGYW